jgi:hypothetical protein
MSKKPDDYNEVIRIGYCGDRAKNRGLERAIAMLKAQYPGAEIVAVKIKAGTRRRAKLDWFNAQLGEVK